MSKFYLLLLFCTFLQMGFSQTNFSWEKVDTTSKNIAQIYSLTKMFVAETWKSSKDVIQNDDKDAGVILVKGSSVQNVAHLLGIFTYVYNYQVTFKMKENKFKIMINNVYCESASFNGAKGVLLIQPFEGDNCPQTTTMTHSGLSKRKAIAMMANLKSELQGIVDGYSKYINKEITKDDW